MWDVLPYLICTEGCLENEGILLANLLQSSKRTFSRGSFLSFLAFKEGMLGTPISVLGGWPTVSGRLFELWVGAKTGLETLAERSVRMFCSTRSRFVARIYAR